MPHRSFFPKRISELSPLESSDDDDAKYVTHLQYIVHNSISTKILFSVCRLPQRNLEEDVLGAAPLQLDVEIKNNHNSHNALTNVLTEKASNSKEPNTSRQLKFNISSDSTTKERPVISLFSKIQTTSIPQCQKQNDALNQSTTPNRNPKTSSSISKSIQKPSENATPHNPFQMPSTRYLPSSSRRFDKPKCASALENEFRTQKVLFTTPSAVSRPIIDLLNNVGLDDSLNCYKSSAVLSNCSQDKIQQKTDSSRTFQSIENSKSSQPVPKDQPKCEEVDGLAVPDKNKTIRINGKDFIVLEKIGQGGSSSVYLAQHKEKKLECALKVRKEI